MHWCISPERYFLTALDQQGSCDQSDHLHIHKSWLVTQWSSKSDAMGVELYHLLSWALTIAELSSTTCPGMFLTDFNPILIMVYSNTPAKQPWLLIMPNTIWLEFQFPELQLQDVQLCSSLHGLSDPDFRPARPSINLRNCWKLMREKCIRDNQK